MKGHMQDELGGLGQGEQMRPRITRVHHSEDSIGGSSLEPEAVHQACVQNSAGSRVDTLWKS